MAGRLSSAPLVGASVAATCALAFAAWFAVSAAARSSPAQVFRVTQDLVLVDVIATDRDGRPVTDLRADELQLTEDGKAQRIIQFQYAGEPRAGSVPTTPQVAPSVTPGASAAFESIALAGPAEAPALVIAFDLHSMRAEVLARTREAVRDVVGALPPSTRLMLVVIDRGLVVRHELTTDVTTVVAAVDAVAPAPETDIVDFDGLVDQVSSVCGMAADATDLMSARQLALGLGRLYLADVSVRLSSALDGLGALSRLLASLPGRKHVVLYSTGYPTRPVDAVIDVVGSLCGDRGGVAQGITTSLDAGAWMTAAIDDANRAQVSVYAVDPRGLVPDNVQARQSRSARASQRGGPMPEVRRQQTETQQFLLTLAGDTGGLAVLNTNDLTRGLRSAATDASQYYLLAFAPQGSRQQGKFYRVGLKTTRPGVNLRYRQGYLWLDAAKRAERDVSLAMRFPALYGSPAIDVAAGVEARRVRVAVIVPTAALRFTPAGDGQRNDIHVVALLRDADGKVVGERYLFAKDVAIKMTAERLAGMLTHDNIEIPGEGPAPRAGQYELVVVVRHSAGRISAKSVALTVP